MRIPGCEGLLTEEDLALYFADSTDTVEIIDTPENWGATFEQMGDEDLRALMAQADGPQACTWGTPMTDNFFTIIIAPLSPRTAVEVEAAIAEQGYPEMHPPARGYSFNDETAGSTGVHLIEQDVWFVFQGGPGSITADDAERHGFATVLGRVADTALP